MRSVLLRVVAGTGAALTVLCLSVGVSVVSGAPGGVAGAALATPLSSVVLTHTLPGFEQLPAGKDNGPLPASTLDTFSNDSEFHSDVSNGSVTGFIRTWSGTYPGGGNGAVVIAALAVPSPSDATQFTAGLRQGVAQQSGSTGQPVPGMNTTGYITHPSGVQGDTGYWIFFSRGDVGFYIYALAPPGDLTLAKLATVAEAQEAAVPADDSTPSGDETSSHHVLAGAVGGALLAGLVVVIVLLIRRRGHEGPEPAPGGPADGAEAAWAPPTASARIYASPPPGMVPEGFQARPPAPQAGVGTLVEDAPPTPLPPPPPAASGESGGEPPPAV